MDRTVLRRLHYGGRRRLVCSMAATETTRSKWADVIHGFHALDEVKSVHMGRDLICLSGMELALLLSFHALLFVLESET